MPEMTLTIGIRVLAGGDCDDIMNTFGISKSGFCHSRNQFLNAMLDCELIGCGSSCCSRRMGKDSTQRLGLKKCELSSEGMRWRIRWLFPADNVSNHKGMGRLSTITLLRTLPITWHKFPSHVRCKIAIPFVHGRCTRANK